MALSEDLINFDLIETHKENIQSLPGGRSAKQLASILSPIPSARTGVSPSFDETKTLNDAIRQEYENELLSIADSDDPLDIYDRYVKWTFNAYPSAQATPQSQLLPLLERATKSFLTSSHYKNDPRYLKLWLHYIRLFSDTPRETFAFLARHHIGEGLGLFYEEFAAWLESAGRWNQADEVYRMGAEKEARPAERLMRKYNQFQQRYEARTQDQDEPSSPALPTVRPALAAKIDPFASASRTEEVQAQRQGPGGNAVKAKSGKPKMAIFSDADNEAPPPSSSTTKGWDSIGSMKERKKENTIEARPWTGETLRAGKRVGTVPKMEIFRDSKPQGSEHKRARSKPSETVNPRTGRSENVFVNLEAVYPSEGEEYSFEELRAMSRGWIDKDWSTKTPSPLQPSDINVASSCQLLRSTESVDVENLSQSFQSKLDVHDSSTQSMVGMPEPIPARQKRLKVREIKQETQTVKTRLDSPTGRKIRRKGAAEPTMTFHSKVATNEIYDIFNQPRQTVLKEDTQSGDDTDYGDDTYSTAGESTGTGRISTNNSEFGDDTSRSFEPEHTISQPEDTSSWPDFSSNKPIPRIKKISKKNHRRMDSDSLADNLDSSQNPTMDTGAFDTQAIAAIADQDFGDMDTKMIAKLAGEDSEYEEEREEEEETVEASCKSRSNSVEDLVTPIEGPTTESHEVEVHQETRFVPIPPEGYEPTPVRPYRDPSFAAQNKLPFMTPIVERTESSLAPSTIFQQDYFMNKTPSRAAHSPVGETESPSKIDMGNLLLGTPPGPSPASVKRRRMVDEANAPGIIEDSPLKRHVAESPFTKNQKIPFPVAKSAITVAVDDLVKTDDVFKTPALPKKVLQAKPQAIHKGPIISDLQCNPCDPAVQKQILQVVHPPIGSYVGFIDRENDDFGHHGQLKSFSRREKSVKSSPRKASPRKSSSDRTLTKPVPPILKFEGTSRVYAIKKELGKGAFAPVYLVDSYDPAAIGDGDDDDDDDNDDLDGPTKPQPKSFSRSALEAVKTESPPISLVWEFHILRLIRSRLGSSTRSMMSIITAHECHLYHDECYLILDYHSQGTILDLVNMSRMDSSRAGKAVEGLEETVAMWLSVELLRTMEAFHKVGILHGDLKADNCLVRFDPGELLEPFNRSGSDGWHNKGMMLIDFGRGIDTKAFKQEARFVADWKAEETDCAEIREARPWKWELDLFGAAGIIHSLLFGKYIETVAIGGGGLGQKKEWKLKDNFKRYWEKEIWTEVFHVLINGGGKDGEEIRKEIARVRGLMEDWLENEGERSGRDLRASIRRCERLVGVAAGGRVKGK